MKSNFKKLLTFALAAYATVASVQAAAELGKDYGLTYVKIQDFYNDAYQVMGGTSLLARENGQREDPFGGSINVVVGLENVMSGNRGSEPLGRGFSATESNEFKIGIKDAVATTPQPLVDARSLVHMYFPTSTATVGANPFVGNVAGIVGTQPDITVGKFEAKHRRVFADFAYTQDLGNFYEGLKFAVSTTLVNVRNNLSVSITGSDPKAVNVDTVVDTTPSLATSGSLFWNGMGIADFFAGAKNVSNDQYNAQQSLAHGKFKAGDQSEVGITDVRASLGLDVLDNDSAKVSVAIDGVLPLGRELKCENLFEPVVGSRHFKLGAKITADASLADGSDYSANLNVQGLWHYSFARKSNRLPWDAHNPYRHYALGYIAGAGATSLRPVIDIVFDQQAKVNVKPGQNVSLLANFNIEKGALVADLLYNFRWSAAESNDAYADIAGLCIANADNATGINPAQRAKQSPSALTTADGAFYAISSQLSSRAASQFTHEVALGLAFMFKEWQYPSSIGLRGGYTIAQERTHNPEKWSVALKGSFCF